MTIDNTPYALGLETDQDKAQIIGLDGSHIAYVEVDPAIDIAKGIIKACNEYDALRLDVSRLVNALENLLANPNDEKTCNEALDALTGE
jgi:hypothetical protein